MAEEEVAEEEVAEEEVADEGAPLLYPGAWTIPTTSIKQLI